MSIDEVCLKKKAEINKRNSSESYLAKICRSHTAFIDFHNNNNSNTDSNDSDDNNEYLNFVYNNLNNNTKSNTCNNANIRNSNITNTTKNLEFINDNNEINIIEGIKNENALKYKQSFFSRSCDKIEKLPNFQPLGTEFSYCNKFPSKKIKNSDSNEILEDSYKYSKSSMLIKEIEDFFYPSTFSKDNSYFSDDEFLRNMKICVYLAEDQDGSRFIQEMLQNFKNNNTTNENNNIAKSNCFFNNNINEIKNFETPIKLNYDFVTNFNQFPTWSKNWLALLAVLRPHLYTLSINQFGNYVIQKFCEEQFTSCYMYDLLLKGAVGVLGVNVYGCRVVQKALECFKVPFSVLEEVYDALEVFTVDQNGVHVVLKSIDRCGEVEFMRLESYKNEVDNLLISNNNTNNNKENDLNFFFKFVKKIILNIVKYSNDEYGCRVIQKVLETLKKLKESSMLSIDNKKMTNYCNGGIMNYERIFYETSSSLEDVILSTIINNTYELAFNQYGNYCLQFIMNEHYITVNKILPIVDKHCLKFSTHKFASNVVETVIKMGTLEVKNKMLENFLKCSSNVVTTNSNFSRTANFSNSGNGVSHGNSNNLIGKKIRKPPTTINLTNLAKKHLKPDIIAIAKDRFGNYVVQQLLKAVPRQSKLKIKSILEKYRYELINSHFSKQIIYKVQNIS